MLDQLKQNNYIIIPKFLSQQETKYYCDKLTSWTRNSAGDEQVPLSKSGHSIPCFIALLCEKVYFLNKLLGSKVLPTYTHARIYLNGAELTPHTDRSACEISVTLHLGGDKEWPIYFTKPNNEIKKVVLNPGDAALYAGCVSSHWRRPYIGQWYAQVFLHYVLSQGNNASHYFDREAYKTIIEASFKNADE